MKDKYTLDEALRLVAEEENAQFDNTPAHAFSDTHNQKMQSLFTKNLQRKNRLLTWGLSAAACVAVVGVALLSGILTPSAPPAPDDGSDGGMAIGGVTTASTTAGLVQKTEIADENMTNQTEIGTPDIWPAPTDVNDTAGNSSTPLYSYFCLHLKTATVTEVNDVYMVVLPDEQTVQGNAKKFCVILPQDGTTYAVGDRVMLELDPSKISQQTITETNEENGTVTAYYVHVIEPTSIQKMEG